MSKLKDGCIKPVMGPIMEENNGSSSASPGIIKEVIKMVAKVGKEAIDFEASAFIAGEGFKPVKLSDYKGKWIVICFYPGDFTYV